MRLSTIEEYGDTANFDALMEHRCTIVIFFNGVEIKDCIMADDVTGEVFHIVRDKNDDVKIKTNGELIVKKLTGKVEIKFT